MSRGHRRRGIQRLRQADLGDGVESIGAEAFRNDYSLVSLVLPAGLSAVGDQAFRNCSALSRMLFLGDAPALGGASVFQYIPASPDRPSRFYRIAFP